MAIRASVNVSRNFNIIISAQSNAIRRSGYRTISDIDRGRAQDRTLSPQDIARNANDLIQSRENGKSAQSRFLDLRV